jgi:hypothetical protein
MSIAVLSLFLLYMLYQISKYLNVDFNRIKLLKDVTMKIPGVIVGR